MRKRVEPGDGSDDDDFARAMAEQDVVPLSRDSVRRVRTAAPVTLPVAGPPAGASPGAEDEDGGEDFAAHGVDRREIRKLKRGDYPPASRLDLHGMNADEASLGVQRFVAGARVHRRACVCIVHGRGLRSPGGVAVLKRRVRALLRSHPAVLAFSDAPGSDGGPGAVYVLLRRRA